MWNDEEDNNPYGTSFDRRDSQTSSSVNPTSPTTRDCECKRAFDYWELLDEIKALMHSHMA